MKGIVSQDLLSLCKHSTGACMGASLKMNGEWTAVAKHECLEGCSLNFQDFFKKKND